MFFQCCIPTVYSDIQECLEGAIVFGVIMSRVTLRPQSDMLCLLHNIVLFTMGSSFSLFPDTFLSKATLHFVDRLYCVLHTKAKGLH